MAIRERQTEYVDKVKLNITYEKTRMVSGVLDTILKAEREVLLKYQSLPEFEHPEINFYIVQKPSAFRHFYKEECLRLRSTVPSEQHIEDGILSEVCIIHDKKTPSKNIPAILNLKNDKTNMNYGDIDRLIGVYAHEHGHPLSTSEEIDRACCMNVRVMSTSPLASFVLREMQNDFRFPITQIFIHPQEYLADIMAINVGFVNNLFKKHWESKPSHVFVLLKKKEDNIDKLLLPYANFIDKLGIISDCSIAFPFFKTGYTEFGKKIEDSVLEELIEKNDRDLYNKVKELYLNLSIPPKGEDIISINKMTIETINEFAKKIKCDFFLECYVL